MNRTEPGTADVAGKRSIDVAEGPMESLVGKF